MNNNFKKYIDLIESVEKYKAILIPEHFSWANDISKSLPALTLDLPSIEKRAKIETILDKKNPIYVQLSDGSKLFFSFDEFKKIHGKPARGKTMVLTMQRLAHDKSDSPSQITKCCVI